MTCERHIERIQELVDGALGPIRRAELEQHLGQCEACQALRTDLERIRDAAAALPPLAPPDGAWLQIAGRLRREQRESPEPARLVAIADAPCGLRWSYGWLAIAAALVLAAGASILMLVRSAPAPTRAGSQAAAAVSAPAAAGSGSPSVEAAQTAVDAAQQQFEKAIADLEKVARANGGAIDPGTSAVIDKNLGIIDRAIAENRAAVKAEPASVAARETLFEALRQKVSLLQDTIALINEMRQGNNAAAAQLVNKS
ncbi:MAG TPA: zf-HC2 domain-containing protein [Vicinamibacterales bacterium]|jgi:anti-sigma factor RsiW